ncbi:MAG: TetR/AcrR family transcriptional regulator [Polyangiaceae bacterium]|jgi:AcrR family transcriptional regulator|nr:TetR/AcrR family transcriptional regulator [Polyangiaceae bacterium]
MTKHRKREEWVEEILDAAARQIVNDGYSNLTMESIAARAPLSKGGVYRHFGNKREVALALFRRVYQHTLDVDLDEAIGWNLPVHETIYRVIVTQREEAQLVQDHRIWVQLIPEIVRDEGFRRERQVLFEALVDKFADLVRRIVVRDSLPMRDDFDRVLRRYVHLAMILREGMSIQTTIGTPISEQAVLYRKFVEVFTRELLGHAPSLTQA